MASVRFVWFVRFMVVGGMVEEKLISTGEAAALLGITRRSLTRMLDDGVMAYYRPNSHRFLRESDVVAFRAQREHKGSGVARMIAAAELAGLYDDEPMQQTP